MLGAKSLQRLLAVQALYQISINELSEENSLDSILKTALLQPGLEELKAAGLLESRLPPNLDIREPVEIDQNQIEPFGEDENIEDLIQSGHEAE